MAPTADRWRALCHRLGASRTKVDPRYQALVAAHANPPRAYHDLTHVAACLEALDELRGEAEQPDLIELALWFHDAIYDPERRDNEARSAELLLRAAADLGLPPTVARRAAALIDATTHRRRPADADERVIIDADLAVLGAAPEAYARYEAAIRREYAHVPDEEFRSGRALVLRRFLERERIFHTESSHAAREPQARRNLTAALRRLSAPGE